MAYGGFLMTIVKAIQGKYPYRVITVSLFKELIPIPSIDGPNRL
jgi:hypothetical protein